MIASNDVKVNVVFLYVQRLKSARRFVRHMGFRTLRRWARNSRKRGIEALEPKKDTVAFVAQESASISWSLGVPSIETYVSRDPPPLEMVLSCVDNNASRYVIQEQLPRTVIGGSTNEMQIQLSIYDLAAGNQCLKCNDPKDLDSDTDELTIERLRQLSHSERESEAKRVSVDPRALDAFLQNPNCGLLGGDSLRKFAHGEALPSFSVGFESAMSGVMLAGEVLRRAYQAVGFQPMLGRENTDFYMNFWYDSCSRHLTLPTPECWCNAPIGGWTPRQIHEKIWKLN